MIRLDGITAVQRRIAEIEQTFGDPRNMLQGADFASNLRDEIEKMKNSSKVDNTVAKVKTAAVDAANGAALSPVPGAPQIAAALPADKTLNNERNEGANRLNDFSSAYEQAIAPTAGDDYSSPSFYDEAEKTSAGSDDVTRFLTEAAARYGVDNRLVSAIAQVESSGNQAAISSAGAIGVMQLMPDTAASLGVNPYDLKENIEGGAKYISNLLHDFGGDVRKAVAAYNAGPNAVKRYGGVPPYAETQNYVSRVLDLYQ